MEIVLIHGQNHKGSSYTIGRKIADKISCEKDITEFFLPRDLNHFCIGCYNCVEDEEKCPYYSEKHRIMEEVEKADILIFTTPTYCLRASAPMKSFIDLTFTYWMSHKPRKCMFKKRAVVVSTTAGVGSGAAIKDISTALGYWGVNANNLSVIGIYPAKKSNRVFRTKHFALMRKFRARGRPSLNDRHRLFQG